MKPQAEHFFFHSFPRRRAGESREAQLEKGVKITRGLLRSGLLLTPENYEIPIISKGSVIDKLEAVQRRVCFTELASSDLQSHSETFGSFALAYTIDDLRKLGAMPVFYVPIGAVTTEDLSGTGVELLGAVTDAKRVVDTIAAVQKRLSDYSSIRMKYRGEVVEWSSEECDILRKFIEVLGDSAKANLEGTRVKLDAVASCFYPTENLNFTPALHYYRQREWRLVDTYLIIDGLSILENPTPDQVVQLLDIDREFFEKKLRFHDSSQGAGLFVEDTIANRSKFFNRLGNIDVVGLAKYFIFPDDIQLDGEQAEEFAKRGITTISQSAFSKAV
jgi:hypothetical protein